MKVVFQCEGCKATHHTADACGKCERSHADGLWAKVERRAPVQATRVRGMERPAGTVSWDEHVLAWHAYDKRYHTDQSAERIAERAGFSFEELTLFLGHEPKTWKPVDVR